MKNIKSMMLKKIKSISGFSMIQVLVALGITVILGTVTLAFIQNQMKSEKITRISSDAEEMKNYFKNLVTDTSSCTVNFRGLQLNSASEDDRTIRVFKKNDSEYVIISNESITALPRVVSGTGADPAVVIADYYRKILGREAAPAEIAAWQGEMNKGPMHIYNGFINSAEYQARRSTSSSFQISRVVLKDVTATPNNRRFVAKAHVEFSTLAGVPEVKDRKFSLVFNTDPSGRIECCGTDIGLVNNNVTGCGIPGFTPPSPPTPPAPPPPPPPVDGSISDGGDQASSGGSS